MSKQKSITTDQPSGTQKAEEASAVSKHATVRQWIDIKTAQNVLFVWLDNNIDKENNENFHNTVTRLRRVTNRINTFTDSNQCIQFLQDNNNQRVCMIISGSLGKYNVPRIHDMSQVDTIFFCNNKEYCEQWAKEWSKRKSVFSEISPIRDALKVAAQRCEQNSISMSVIATTANPLNTKLDQLDPTFMYTQIFKEILSSIKFGEDHIKQFIAYCREQFTKDEHELTTIAQLETKYHHETPIRWYTSKSFLFSMLNRALRKMDSDIMIQMGFFINDLHQQIDQLHQEQFPNHHNDTTFIVYRGQGLSKVDFDQIKNNMGGLLCFNNFLSTSKDRDVSRMFADSNQTNTDLVGILFVMIIDPSISSTPFASIKDVSYFKDEDEVLFSMNTVFRIRDVQPIDGNARLFQVTLTLTSDDDNDLRLLTAHIREETKGSTGWHRLGVLLRIIGQPKEAQEIYKLLLEQTTDERDQGNIYKELIRIKYQLGEYREAVVFYEKSLEIYRKCLFPNHRDFAQLYNSIGSVYRNIGDYSKALSFQEKALEIRQQSLPSSYPDLAVSYNTIGNVHYNLGDYSTALSYYQKSLKIRQQTLPSNHSHLAMSYNNIGLVYDSIGDYSKALSHYEKTLAIQKQSLPSNHPDLAMSYNNIGLVYHNMSDYSTALSSHGKALEIQQQSFSSNHPNLAKSYISLGLVYYNIGDYSKALSHYKKALRIQQQSLPSNHPDLAMSYGNIGLVYHNMGDYSKALSSHEKSLAIRQQSLPSYHPDLAMSYGNIGNVYYNIGDYPKALFSHEKALAITQQSLPLNHPDLAMSYGNIGNVYYNMGDYSKALSHYEKTLGIQQQSLPSYHPDLAMSYGNIGNVYCNIGDYPKALSSHEKALAIQQQSLPLNHPDLAMSYGNIGNVYYNIGDYPKALSSHEKALAITQQSLPSSHPKFSVSYNNIGLVYDSMGEYSKALSYYERALNIAQRSSTSNHPHLQLYRKNLDLVKKKLMRLYLFVLLTTK